MDSSIVILTCLLGVFAIAFGLAGFVGLAVTDSKGEREDVFLTLVDCFIPLSFLATMRNVLRNWKARKRERRLLYVGAVCAVSCAIILRLA